MSHNIQSCLSVRPALKYSLVPMTWDRRVWALRRSSAVSESNLGHVSTGRMNTHMSPENSHMVQHLWEITNWNFSPLLLTLNSHSPAQGSLPVLLAHSFQKHLTTCLLLFLLIFLFLLPLISEDFMACNSDDKAEISNSTTILLRHNFKFLCMSLKATAFPPYPLLFARASILLSLYKQLLNTV